jgi:hypothetical protein
MKELCMGLEMESIRYQTLLRSREVQFCLSQMNRDSKFRDINIMRDQIDPNFRDH